MQGINSIPIPTESDEQQALFRYCSVEMGRYPELEMLAHIPNEGKRSKATGGRLKKEGLRKGYPDIVLNVSSKDYHALFIELKRRKGSKKTQEQKDWIRKLNEYGYAAVFCYGWEEAWEVIHAYLVSRFITASDHASKKILKKYIYRSLEEAGK